MNPQKEIILKEHFFYITLIGLEVVYMISGWKETLKKVNIPRGWRKGIKGQLLTIFL
jgi:hypothetical protein